MKIFSEEWAEAYHIAINNNDAHAVAASKWNLGKLALILDDRAVILDLDSGYCHAVESTSAETAQTNADFVISGNENTWQEVLAGKLQPLMGIMNGKLKLSKGSIGKLMPFAKAAIELVNSAQTVETEF